MLFIIIFYSLRAQVAAWHNAQRKSIGDVAAFIAVSARLPMLGKDKIFQVKIKCLINFRRLEPKPNSIHSAQWHMHKASHIANANVGRINFYTIAVFP
jgi:hypothetical protein